MNVLREWSNKYTSEVIFDSKVNGDGSNNALYNRLKNHNNLYIISFDTSSNVYGGCINVKIDQIGNFISDNKLFVFSLKRNCEMNNKIYFLKQNEGKALYLQNISSGLYEFGGCFGVHQVGKKKKSWYEQPKCYYDYGNDKSYS